MKKILVICLLLTSCARTKLNRVEDALRPVKGNMRPITRDSLGADSFFATLKKHIEVMKQSKLVRDPMVFGKKLISKADYIAALEKIPESKENYLAYINEHFDVMEVYGRNQWGDVLATGYYEPLLNGSRTKTERFSAPLYKAPEDLITVDLKLFESMFKRYDFPAQLTGKLKGKTLVPYFDRKEIDIDKKLEGKNLELAWVDPAEAFFLHIQGSGVVRFENDEELHVGYNAQNGHPYQAIGKLLHHVIPKDEMSTQKIKAYLKTLTKEQQQDLLNKNPSYVFFKKLEGEAITYAGMEVSEGRTIATDNVFFPKGALAYLDIEEPQFENQMAEVPSQWIKVPRLVFDQDTGGAIKGGDRVDLYFGKGDEAFQKAGVMKRMGKLYYLVPKQ